MKTIIQKSVLSSLLIIFFGCQKQKEGKVEIHLISTEVHSLDKESNGNRFTEEEKEKSKNTITFKLVNNTGKKQLLIFNPYDSGFSNLMPEVKDKKGNINKWFPGIVDYFDDSEFRAYKDCEFSVSMEEYKRYENLGIKNIPNYIDYRENQIILYPGEERTFKTVIYLPDLSASVNRFASGKSSFRGIKEGDSLYLKYSTYVPRYKNALPDWELKELNEKGIHFYADTIQSNAIPIKLIK